LTDQISAFCVDVASLSRSSTAHVLPLLSVIEVMVWLAAAVMRQPMTMASPVPAAAPVAETV
jgi:hypothetical protein